MSSTKRTEKLIGKVRQETAWLIESKWVFMWSSQRIWHLKYEYIFAGNGKRSILSCAVRHRISGENTISTDPPCFESRSARCGPQHTIQQCCCCCCCCCGLRLVYNIQSVVVVAVVAVYNIRSVAGVAVLLLLLNVVEDVNQLSNKANNNSRLGRTL